jgi:hypothetical protein
MKLERNRTESKMSSVPAGEEPQHNERKSRYFQLPHYIVFNQFLSVPLRFLLIALIERENNFKGMQKGAPFFLTQERLACQLGIAISTLKRNLAALEKKGFIQRKFEKGDRATRYTINWELIDQFNKQFEFADVPTREDSPIREPNTLSSITENRETRESAAEPIMNPTRVQNEPQQHDYYRLWYDDGKPF